jgi:hypothetical protein
LSPFSCSSCCGSSWPLFAFPLVAGPPPPPPPPPLSLWLLVVAAAAATAAAAAAAAAAVLVLAAAAADIAAAEALLALLAACTFSRGSGKSREGSTNSLPIQLVPWRVEKSDAECVALRFPWRSLWSFCDEALRKFMLRVRALPLDPVFFECDDLSLPFLLEWLEPQTAPDGSEPPEDDPDKMPLSSGVDGDGPPRLP